MPQVKLDAVHAAELAELPQFLSQWLAHDPGRLADSLGQFVGHPAYGLSKLRGDLERFVFLTAAATASPCSACPVNSPPGDLICQESK